MNFLLSDELKEFRDVLRKFLNENISADYRRKNFRGEKNNKQQKLSVEDLGRWKKLAELGVFSAALPENCDGLGFGALARQIILEETAAALVPLPIFESSLAANCLQAVGATEYIKRIASGELLCSAAISPLDSAANGACSVRAQKDGLFLVSGNLEFVPSPELCGEVLFFAEQQKSKGSFQLFSLPTEENSWTAVPTFDLLRPYSERSLKDLPLKPVSEKILTAENLRQLRAELAVAFVAEMVGAAERAIQMSVDYIKTRQQFGRPIGSFQAVQHKLADMHLKVEQAKSLGRFAAWSIDHDPSQLLPAATAAKAFASEVLPEVVEQAIQVHGGIGFTFEFDLHLYLRRVIVLSQVFLPKSSAARQLSEFRLAEARR